MEIYKGDPSPLTSDEQAKLAKDVITGQCDPWGMIVDTYRTALLKNNDPALVEALRSGLENAFGSCLPRVISFLEEKNKPETCR